MLRDQSFSPDSLIPFQAYRTPRPDGKGFIKGEPEIWDTVAHFYFSERFRSINESARVAIQLMPSASEARKVAQRTTPPESWMTNRLRIIRTALWFQFKACPKLPEALLSGEVPIGDARSLGKGWEPRNRGNERWQQVVEGTAKRFLSQDRMILLASGDVDVFNPFLFSSRLAQLLGDKQVHEILIGCRTGADAMAEQWAIETYTPVSHHPIRAHDGKDRAEQAIEAITSLATHALVFSKGADKTIAKMLHNLKTHQTPTRLVRLDNNGRPLPKPRAIPQPAG